MATAGPRIPTSGTNTEGNQAAANSPVMARANSNRYYCTKTTRRSLRGRLGRHKNSIPLPRLSAAASAQDAPHPVDRSSLTFVVGAHLQFGQQAKAEELHPRQETQ